MYWYKIELQFYGENIRTGLRQSTISNIESAYQHFYQQAMKAVNTQHVKHFDVQMISERSPYLNEFRQRQANRLRG